MIPQVLYSFLNSVRVITHSTCSYFSDALIKPIKVEAEGFPQEETWSKYICAEGEIITILTADSLTNAVPSEGTQ